MNELAEPVGSNDHVRGRPDAAVTLVEYGDFECPYCARADGEVNEVLRRVGRDVAYVFRNFPLTRIHPHALLASQAAEAAGAQGRFWRMHALLFQNQDALEPEDLMDYAQALDLDVDRFADDIRTGRHLPRVEHDFQTGVRSGVQGTPSFFVNGRHHDRSWDADSVTAAIRQALRGRAAPNAATHPHR